MNGTKPTAQSTPNQMIRGRRNIKDHNDSVLSPVPIPESADEPDRFTYGSVSKSPSQSPHASSARNRHPVYQANDDTASGSDSEESDGPEPNHRVSGDGYRGPQCTLMRPSPPQHSAESSLSRGRDGLGSKFLVGLLWVVLMGLVFYYFPSSDTSQIHSAEQLRKALEPSNFGNLGQEPHFWSDIRVQIQEVLAFNSPRTIVFLYKKEERHALHDILKIVGEKAACYLRSCGKQAVRLDSASIKDKSRGKDYGVIGSRYQQALAENGVLIMENLDEISGQDAQVFHAFCDDSSPVVADALILFTVQVKEWPELHHEAEFLRRLLFIRWNDIGEHDKFHPLFARIAGVILTVKG